MAAWRALLQMESIIFRLQLDDHGLTIRNFSGNGIFVRLLPGTWGGTFLNVIENNTITGNHGDGVLVAHRQLRLDPEQ